jgi:biopolymer transport protein ExbD
MEFYRPSKKPLMVPIIPLIDILAILLIFFIVSYAPKKPRKARPILQIDLPTVKEVPSTVVVNERAVLAVTRDGRIVLDDYELAGPGFLVDALQVFKRENPERKLELEADQGVTIAQLFLIWDALTQVGIEIKDVPARIQLPDREPEPFVDPLQP